MCYLQVVPESVTIHEAKTQFSKLVRRAEAGEEIVVRRGRQPVARIMPLERKRGGVTGRGSMKGKIWMVSDEEMKKVDEEIEQMFEESVVFPEEKAQPDET
jgi:prevent-host-death family protein